jgi:hypothetical protein
MDERGRRPNRDRGRLPEQLLLPLLLASSAAEPASLSTAIQTTLPRPRNDRDSPQRRYIRAVLARYLWLPETPSVTSRHDRSVAKTLFERGVSLLVVEAALLLAAARRALRDSGLPPLPHVRALHYYLPVVAELLDEEQPPEHGYLIGLLGQLRPLAEGKAARLHRQDRVQDSAHCAHQAQPTRAIRRSRAENPR